MDHAREIQSLNEKLLTPQVLEALIKKINNRQVTNSVITLGLPDCLRQSLATTNAIESVI